MTARGATRMRDMLTRAALVVTAMVAVAGCKHRTEMIISVQTAGVRIPDDVAKLRFLASDHVGDTSNQDVWMQDVNLCTAQITTGCYTLGSGQPITALLFPGDTHPHDVVRIEVDALDQADKKVISDAALFAFASEQTLHIDFVLYANCLGVDCAVRDLACGPDAHCVDVGNVGPGGQSDGGSDGGGLGDMAGNLTPPDLTSTLDMAGCAAITCNPGNVCIAGQCQRCGMFAGDPCCDTQPSCDQATSLTCNGSICVPCGTAPNLCCSGNMCFFPSMCMANGYCSAADMAFTPPDMALMPSDLAISPATD
jgi:hypothetical protein